MVVYFFILKKVRPLKNVKKNLKNVLKRHVEQKWLKKNVRNEKGDMTTYIIQIKKITIKFFMPIHLKMYR